MVSRNGRCSWRGRYTSLLYVVGVVGGRGQWAWLVGMVTWVDVIGLTAKLCPYEG